MRPFRWWLRQVANHPFDVFCTWNAFGWGVNLCFNNVPPVGPHQYLQAFVPPTLWGMAGFAVFIGFFLGIHGTYLTRNHWTIIEARTLSAVFWLVIASGFVLSEASITGWWNYALIGLLSSLGALLAPRRGPV